MFINKEKFLLDDNGKIRNCTRNIDKMNIIEYAIFSFPKINKEWLMEYFIEPMVLSFKYSMLFWAGLILFLGFPISFPIITIIKYSKRERVPKEYK